MIALSTNLARLGFFASATYVLFLIATSSVGPLRGDSSHWIHFQTNTQLYQQLYWIALILLTLSSIILVFHKKHRKLSGLALLILIVDLLFLNRLYLIIIHDATGSMAGRLRLNLRARTPYRSVIPCYKKPSRSLRSLLLNPEPKFICAHLKSVVKHPEPKLPTLIYSVYSVCSVVKQKQSIRLRSLCYLLLTPRASAICAHLCHLWSPHSSTLFHFDILTS